jgi:hypothetical protein
MMKWQDFEQEDYLKGFSAMIQQSSPMSRSCHKGVDDTHSEVGEKEISKEAAWFKTVLRSVIPSRNHHQGDSMVIKRLRVGP